MRRIGVSLVVLLSCASWAFADHVVLPVSCYAAQGRLFVKASPVTTHAVVGRHAKRPYTICAPNNGRRCRTLVIHKFDIACAGRRVAWRDIAATIIRRRGAGATVVDGRLRFRLKPPGFAALNPLCEPGHRLAPGDRQAIREWNLRAICDDAGFTPRVGIELPSGFAPLTELGGRFIAGPTKVAAASPATTGTRHASKRVVTDVRSTPRPAVARTEVLRTGSSGSAVASIEQRAPQPEANTGSRPPGPTDTRSLALVGSAAAGTAAPPPGPTPQKEIRVASAGNTAATANDTSTWHTFTRVVANTTNGSPAARQRAQQSMVATVLGLALITSLVSGIGWFATQQLLSLRSRKADPYQVILRREVVDLAKPDAQMCGELCRSGQSLIGEIHTRVDEIQGAAPLRRVLLREVRSMEQFLATTIQAAPDDPREWRRMRLRLQRVVTDLIRLKDITDGARRSLTTKIISDELPRDKQEAYEVLGANPEASEKILKRLVDALRATWHPDLAANDDDRELRDRRIKQINVAWDLIIEKRTEA